MPERHEKYLEYNIIYVYKKTFLLLAILKMYSY